MSDIFRDHFKWVYTISQRLGCYMILYSLVDAGIIVPFLAILYTIWSSWFIIDIITVIHVTYFS